MIPSCPGPWPHTPVDAEVIIAMTAPPQAAVDLARSLVPGRKLRIEITGTPGMSAGVNLGTRMASHGKILVLDSDCVPPSRDHRGLFGGPRGPRLCPGRDPGRAEGLVEPDGGPGDGEGSIGCSGTGHGSSALRSPSGRPNSSTWGATTRRWSAAPATMNSPCASRGGALPVYFCEGAVLVHQPITFRIDTRSHIGYGRGMAYIDRKYGGSYGLDYCRKRLSPRELWIRAVERGAYVGPAGLDPREPYAKGLPRGPALAAFDKELYPIVTENGPLWLSQLLEEPGRELDALLGALV